VSQNQIVTDAQVEDALEFLRASATDVGAARAAMIRTERLTKHRQAIFMKKYSNLPVSAQEREIR